MSSYGVYGRETPETRTTDSALSVHWVDEVVPIVLCLETNHLGLAIDFLPSDPRLLWLQLLRQVSESLDMRAREHSLAQGLLHLEGEILQGLCAI
jgi:hypothetical protein